MLTGMTIVVAGSRSLNIVPTNTLQLKIFASDGFRIIMEAT